MNNQFKFGEKVYYLEDEILNPDAIDEWDTIRIPMKIKSGKITEFYHKNILLARINGKLHKVSELYKTKPLATRELIQKRRKAWKAQDCDKILKRLLKIKESLK